MTATGEGQTDGGDRPAMVRIAGLGKEYVKYEDTPILLSSVFRMRSKTRRSRLWAVRGVDLEVKAGETVGVIGRNGSGKSTMLRMLAGVTAPTEGSVEVRGRVAPLISVGVGFHQELTGRENVYVNGTVLGLTRRQVDERFDDILAFAEIEDFIDTPVKFYSSGMFVRLGFAVAVAAEPDLLLVDEVLAVGDIAFQVKCFVRMRELQDAGSTIIVVSHNLSSVRNLCSRVLVLHDGRPVFLGPTDEAISVYHEVLATSHSTAPELEGAAPVELVEFALLNKEGRRTSHVESREEISLLIRIRLRVAQEEPVFSFSIATEAGMPIYGNTNWGYFSERVSYGADQELVCRIRMPALLMTGSYTAIGNVMWDQDHEKQLSSKPLVFYVSGRNLGHGIVDLGASFEVDRSEVARPLVDDTAHDGHSQDERAVPDRTYGQSADVGEVGEEHER